MENVDGCDVCRFPISTGLNIPALRNKASMWPPCPGAAQGRSSPAPTVGTFPLRASNLENHLVLAQKLTFIGSVGIFSRMPRWCSALALASNKYRLPSRLRPGISFFCNSDPFGPARFHHVLVSPNRTDDGDWTNQKSCVCLWNLDRRGLRPKQPDLVLDVPAAVTAVCCHPERPALIAGPQNQNRTPQHHRARTRTHRSVCPCRRPVQRGGGGVGHQLDSGPGSGPDRDVSRQPQGACVSGRTQQNQNPLEPEYSFDGSAVLMWRRPGSARRCSGFRWRRKESLEFWVPVLEAGFCCGRWTRTKAGWFWSPRTPSYSSRFPTAAGWRWDQNQTRLRTLVLVQKSWSRLSFLVLMTS